jgi:predicted MFS family arabinose efflux permease
MHNFAVCFGLGVLQNVFPKQAHGFGLGAAAFGWLLFAMGLARTAIFLGAALSWSIISRRAAVLGGLVLAALSLILCMQSKSTGVLFMAFSMHGLAMGMAYYVSYLQSVVGLEGRGRKTGMHEATLVGGIMTGSLLGGISARVIGPGAPYLIGVVILVGVAITGQIILHVADASRTRRMT